MNQAGNQFLRFCLVGCAGFVVDASIVYVATFCMYMSPYAGRVLSYVTAATVTWLLNRQFTFASVRQHGLQHEWLGYVAANAVGAFANFATYVLCVWRMEPSGMSIVIGVAAGSIVGLLFNFSASKWWVFRS